MEYFVASVSNGHVLVIVAVGVLACIAAYLAGFTSGIRSEAKTFNEWMKAPHGKDAPVVYSEIIDRIIKADDGLEDQITITQARRCVSETFRECALHSNHETLVEVNRYRDEPLSPPY